MKIVLLTSDNLRHKYIAHSLAVQLDLPLIITEKKSSGITETCSYGEEEALFIKEHFEARETSEEQYFNDFRKFPSTSTVIEVSYGEINSAQVGTAIEKIEPQFIVLFGTSIIKKQLLEKYPGRIINLHLGISPYYRGSATNLFPYFYKEPECVGGTIHLATTAVDRGDILHQFRPNIEQGDNLHDIGNKTILKAGKILPKILKKYNARNITPKKQENSGKLCRNKDLSPEVLKEIYMSFDGGLMEDYLADKRRRDEAKPIVKNYTN
ncbi:formyltransferase family protein [Salinimicrobium sp. MT39]|uniref:phosphoribosylglycinamide formyltransferase 1 n=1 Tax=Salinimicrobium profundisediminis TaxID=2994553 RepID=A0A9X3CVJ7_9FLAO|nr:formyltransferase family protein [Salinimicrobium profundisediminis]MCX2837479.1 formyltransferase family protein [Salinimicrobium profundisediminis]